MSQEVVKEKLQNNLGVNNNSNRRGGREDIDLRKESPRKVEDDIKGNYEGGQKIE